MHDENQVKDQIFQKLLQYLQKTEDFALEQSPEIIKQVLKYEKINSFITACLMVALLTGALSIAWYFWKYPTLEKWGGRDLGSIFGLILPLCISPMFFIQLCYSVDTLIKMYISPKYFLISLIMSMDK